MKILNSVWFSQMRPPSTIGIVVGEDAVTSEKKAYIGTGFGVDEDRDRKMIAEYGSPFPLEIVQGIADQLSRERLNEIFALRKVLVVADRVLTEIESDRDVHKADQIQLRGFINFVMKFEYKKEAGHE